MNRRRFLAKTPAAALTLKAPLQVTPPRPRPHQIKLGCQSAPTNDAHLAYFARYGVRHICGYPDIPPDRTYATVDELHRMKDRAATHNIEILCFGPPILESSFIDREKHPAIMLAQSPERDRDVDMVQALHTYREIGYQYMLMPDHVPTAATDPHGLQSFAFCYGYIRGLLQSLDHPA